MLGWPKGKYLLGFLWFEACNLIDIFGTLFGVSTGRAKEANPFMASLLSQGYFYFIAFKIGFGLVAGILLFGVKGVPRTKRITTRILLTVYTLLAVYQVTLYFIFR